jgi:hypothetical protein
MVRMVEMVDAHRVEDHGGAGGVAEATTAQGSRPLAVSAGTRWTSAGRVDLSGEAAVGGAGRVDVSRDAAVGGAGRVDLSGDATVGGAGRVDLSRCGAVGGAGRVDVSRGELVGGAGRVDVSQGELVGGAGRVDLSRGWAAVGGVVSGALGVAMLAMFLLHLMGIGRLDPATTTVSDYVSVPGGALLLGAAVLGVATATAAMAISLLRTGLPGTTRPCLLYGLGCAGLVATIAFPTNAVGTPASADTILHRYAAALFFVSLPVAALLTRRLLPDRTVGLLTAASAAIGMAFLISHIPLVLPNWPGAPEIATYLPRGLAERGLLTVDIALLAALARSIRQAVR